VGYLRHECMVVSSWDRKAVERAHKSALLIFKEYDLEEIVGDVTPHKMNGGAAFLIAPDGSKEGWSHSHDGDEARKEFKAYLKGVAGKDFVEWCEVLIGGDDGEYRVTASPNGAEHSVPTT
jgi:hypothetical protein